ncbi:MAG: hypothetical protein H6744_09560 [Deltaproteobacteria bacterium]|nr:hypothetical protein [Deltaproteobacteria bacterium]
MSVRRTITSGWVLGLLAIVSVAACDDGKKSNGDSCETNDECGSGFCAVTCLDPDGDQDGDGLINRLESLLQTGIDSSDTDGDGIDDSAEVGPDRQNPLDGDGDGVIDALESAIEDVDGDCISDQLDPTTDTHAALVAAHCAGVGLCADADAASVELSCPDGLGGGAPACDFTAVAGFDANDDTCDGVDSDCDGDTDEGFVGAACDSTNEFGTCAGTTVCVSGQTSCDAAGPAAETCDGADQDCDGDTDESTCDDGDPCTDDVCSGAEGCSNEAKDCDDSDACTTDTCDAETGDCVHAALDCDDSDACTTDSCEASTGACIHAAVVCDDSDACTDDSCDSETGCTTTATVCDDQDPCTVDACDAATGCSATAKDCDDSDACTTDTCNAATGACEHTAVDCDDSDACTTDSCDAVTGCAHAALDCDDSDACTTDACDSETGCTTTPLSCDDSDACTTDSCDSETGCAHDPVVCDDSDACTADSCDAVEGCQHAEVDCDDSDACTTDSCDTQSGCVHEEVNCDDSDACTNDLCDASSGCINDPIICDDEDACTTDSCDSETGCATTPVDCDDEDACTTDSCDTETGCAHADIVCDDSDACTTDACDAAEGCTTTQVDCDDSDACTTDSCDSATGCVHTPIVCDDEDACTTDACDAAEGCTTTPVDCDDSDACTTDTCDSQTGCAYEAVDCDDQSACTIDGCDTATGCTYEDVVCDDEEPCTDDLCDPAEGCYTQPTVCDDGDICNGAEACEPGEGCYTVPAGGLLVEGFETGALGWTTDSLDTNPQGEGGPLNLWQITGETGGLSPVAFDSLAFGTPNNGDEGYEHSYLESPSFDLRRGGVITFRSFVSNEDSSLGIEGDGEGGSDVGGPVLVDVVPEATLIAIDPYAPPTLVPKDLVEQGFDKEILQVSYDGGFSWTTLLGVGDPRWRLQKEWQTFEVRVAADLGTAQTRFRFVYDTVDNCCGDADVVGWFIDDFTVETSAALVCDDGSACTDDQCDPTTGCFHTGVGESCDDGDVCTQDFCIGWLGCINPSLASQCDDGASCTGDVCDPVEGCTFVYESSSTADPFDTVGGWTTGTLNPELPNHWALQQETGGTSPETLDSLAWVNTNAFASLGLEESFLQSPPYDTVGGARITFVSAANIAEYVSGELETPFGDGQFFEYSTDGGVEWNELLSPGDSGWAPQSGPTEIHLSSGDGAKSTLFRFVFRSFGPPAEGPAEVQGWIIDDFTVETPYFDPCDDGVACTDDVCLPYEGCSFEDACDDNDVCTDDYCDVETGECAAPPHDCGDGNPCTADLCDPTDGCFYDTAFDCDDENPCTFDVCNPLTGACGHDYACAEGEQCNAETGACLDCSEQSVDFDSPAPPISPDLGSCSALLTNGSAEFEGLTFTHAATLGSLYGCLESGSGPTAGFYAGTLHLETGSVSITFPTPVSAVSFQARDFLNYAFVMGPWTVDVSWEGGSSSFTLPGETSYTLISLEFPGEISTITFTTSDTGGGQGVAFGLDGLTWIPAGECPASTCGDAFCDEGENCVTCPGDCGACELGNCCENTGEPGCSSPELTSCVCDFDPFCCDTVWDEVCGDEIAACGGSCASECGDGTCDINGGESCDSCPSDCGFCDECTIVTCDASGCTFEPNPACYTLFAGDSTWQESRDFCAALGGYLVGIQSAEENALVRSLAQSYCETTNIHIGLSDEAEEGVFVWADGSPLTYTNWAPSEPSNTDDEDYVEMWDVQVQGSWNDHGPGVVKTCTVCEFGSPAATEIATEPTF